MSGINLFLRLNEEPSAVLQLVQRISRSRSAFHRYQTTVDSCRHLAFKRLILQESVCHNSFTRTHVHYISTHTHDTATRNSELQLYTVIHKLHLSHFAFANGHKLNNLTRTLFRRINRQLLYRLALNAINLFDDDLRLTDLQLVSFATHGLNQYRQMQHTATEYRPGRVIHTRFYAQSQVLLQLFHQPVMDMTTCHILTVLAEERTIVNREHHRHRRFVNSNRSQRFRILYITYCVANLEAFYSDKCADIATRNSIGLHMTHTFKRVQFFYLRTHFRSVFLCQTNGLPVAQCSTMHTTDGYSSYIRIIVQRRNQHLRRSFQHFRLRDIFNDCIHQRRQIRRRLAIIGTHPTILGRTEDSLEVQLIVVSIQVHHQIKHGFLYLVRTTIELIHFVNHHNRLQVQLQRFLQHKTRLRHRTFERINQQQHAVSHVQYTLYFTTKIRVTRSVNDVNLVTLVVNRYVLCKNSNAAFTFQVVVIQYQLLVRNTFLPRFLNHFRCVQHLVHQRCLSVVHMSNNCYISYLLHSPY